MMPIMGANDKWAAKSENVVNALVNQHPMIFSNTGDKGFTLLMGESAHIMNTYSYSSFLAKLTKMKEYVNKASSSAGAGWAKGNRLVWRENWAINEESTFPTEYGKPPDPNWWSGVKATGTLQRLSCPQAEMHKSMVLDVLNHGTDGKVLVAGNMFWMSKSFSKFEKWVPKCVFLECDDDIVYDQDLPFRDVRHMTDEVVLASVLEFSAFIASYLEADQS